MLRHYPSRVWTVIALSALLMLLFTPPAHADVGLPMLLVVWPDSWFLFFLVVPIEALFAKRLFKCTWRIALKTVAIANLVSTLVGIPITWLLLVGIELAAGGGGVGPSTDTLRGKLYAVTIQSPWLMPYDHDLYWMIPVAAAILCIPFYFMSVASEYWMMKRIPDFAGSNVKRWAWQANLASYTLILIVLGVLIFKALSGSR